MNRTLSVERAGSRLHVLRYYRRRSLSVPSNLPLVVPTFPERGRVPMRLLVTLLSDHLGSPDGASTRIVHFCRIWLMQQ